MRVRNKGERERETEKMRGKESRKKRCRGGKE